MAASFDPVALDQACSDLCCQATRFENSQIADNIKKGLKPTKDLWKDSTPESVWDMSLIHGEKIGLGSRKYKLEKF